MLLKTSLHDAHQALGATLFDFHGWEMPLHYGSQLDEHRAVRAHAGVFDVSHMAVVDILGAGGRQFLRQLLTNDIDTLQNGRAMYTCMCNEHGGIIDDLLVYQRAPDNYRLVLNAARRADDIAWIMQQSEGFAVGIQNRPELSLLAVQGPEAIAKLMQVLSPAEQDAISTVRRFECVEVGEHFFARTGYTGEDGFEILLPATAALSLWQALIQHGVKPCGLAARDTLRLEAGFMLYGQDMDTSTTPLESGLSWVVKWQPEDRPFIGRGALLSIKREGSARQLIGLKMDKKQGILRHGQRLKGEGGVEGVITSGGYSPTCDCSIALARVTGHPGDTLAVLIRDQWRNATVSPPRFIEVKKG